MCYNDSQMNAQTKLMRAHYQAPQGSAAKSPTYDLISVAELVAFRKSRISYLVSIHFGCKIIMWEFANHNPATSLTTVELDRLNEPVKGNILLSTEAGMPRKDKYDVPV